MKKSLQSGFSLLEFTILLAVVILLTGVISPSVIRHLDQAKVDVLLSDFRDIEQALTRYQADVGELTPLNDIGSFTTGESKPSMRHFRIGDGQEGWNGPYLDEILIDSSFGGSYDVNVLSPTEATIDLGTQAQLGKHYTVVLQVLNDTLDGDNDLARGVVWGDNNGVHLGFNFSRP